MDQRTVKLRRTLRWRLTFFVLLIMLVSSFLTATIAFVLFYFYARTPLVSALANRLTLVISLLATSAIIGTVLSAQLGKLYLRPLKTLSRATKEVRRGNFTVQVEERPEQLSEMGELISSFNEMVRELGSVEIFRNDFINNFSHEFKTPIVSIRGFARELQKGDLDEATRAEYAAIIADEANRLSGLAINVLELTKLENQQIVSDRTEFDLDEQLRRCILLHETEWSRKEIEIIPELEEVKIYASEPLLSHVWSNLIGNAIKFTPEGGRVSVSLHTEGKEAVVTVEDTGIGMDASTMEHIFDRFYQGDPSHHTGGFGVGLALVKRALILTGGSITVASTPGKGSCFTVRLPLE